MARQLRSLFRTFSTSAKPINKLMDDIDSQAFDALRSAEIREKHEAIRSASVVLLSGFLESFLRDSAEIFFVELKNRGLKYSELPEIMHETHFIGGLEEAHRIAKSDKKNNDSLFLGAQAAVRDIWHPPTSGVSALFWRAFAVTKGNPGPDVIADYLRNFGVKNPLGRLAEESGIAEKSIRSTLRTFIELRNECAHTGAVKNTPQPSGVRDFVLFLRALTLSISKVLEKKLAEIDAEAKASRILIPTP